jgi:hypothetical protein|tara:strand:- start:36 stop:452 length:417 start_codon:yes stop_codon:yes gene_type:complete
MNDEGDAAELHDIAKDFHRVLDRVRNFCIKTKDGRLWETMMPMQHAAVDLYGHQQGYQGIYESGPDQFSLTWDLETMLLNVIDGKPDDTQIRTHGHWFHLVELHPDEAGNYSYEAHGRIDDQLWNRYQPSRPELAPDA